jgi:hypothetical protein
VIGSVPDGTASIVIALLARGNVQPSVSIHRPLRWGRAGQGPTDPPAAPANGKNAARLGFSRSQTLLQILQNSGQFADRSFAQTCGGTRLFAEKLLEYFNLPYRFAFFHAFFCRPSSRALFNPH